MHIVISGALLRFTGFTKEVDVGQVASVRQALSMLVMRYPELENILFEPGGVPRKHHRILVNSKIISRDALDQSVNESDQLMIITAIAGG
jgi:molybdopterin converting factor small subunit